MVAASRWLARQTISDTDLEAQLQRIFALWASRSGRTHAAFASYGHALPEFCWFEYKGDPLPALAAHRALLLAGFRHASLAALNEAYCRLLPEENGSNQGLMRDLLVSNGGNVASSNALPDAPPIFPSPAEMTIYDRIATVELCRRVTLLTSCGARLVDLGEIPSILPSMCFSYAKQWDIETACSLLRICVYLGLYKSRICDWVREWVLDQQQNDGQFGLFAPEAHRGGWTEADWSSYWGPTINAIWAIAELNQPGFILQG